MDRQGVRHEGGEDEPRESTLSLTRAPMAADRAVGRRIRDLRRAAGMTQRSVSAMLGITSAQVHRYEHGVARISTGRLLKIADCLGVSIETLLEGASLSPPRGVENPSEVEALTRAFLSIRDPDQREALLVLARSMARRSARPTAVVS